jgi:ATP-dependent 26S proteasome regulatory subunit
MHPDSSSPPPLLQAPEGSFDELYGLDGPIAELKSTVLLALRRPEIYARYGVRGPRGILVHGPSGTGKSKLCMALANEMGINFVHVKVRECIG